MDELADAIIKEITIRQHELEDEVKSIYFGGGTPSLLKTAHFEKLFNVIYKNFNVSASAEITLEANPDDLTETKLIELRNTPFNRLSIGIQSFNDEDLQLMNRTHNSTQAEAAIRDSVRHGFENISADFIYGLPGMSLNSWNKNLDKMFSLPVKHLSCYCLTVEPGTQLHKQVLNNRVRVPGDDLNAIFFETLMDRASQESFEHYEISSFSLPGYHSRHNSAYWNGSSYSGFGPSAHSYDGARRWFNIASNAAYIQSLKQNTLPVTEEHLTDIDKYNEYIMVSLRTSAGADIEQVERNWPGEIFESFRNEIKPYLKNGYMNSANNKIKLTNKGKLLADRIASSLFYSVKNHKKNKAV